MIHWERQVLQSTYLHVDETPITVLDKDKKDQTHRGYYWVYQNSIRKIVLFDYQAGRGREGPISVWETSRAIDKLMATLLMRSSRKDPELH